MWSFTTRIKHLFYIGSGMASNTAPAAIDTDAKPSTNAISQVSVKDMCLWKHRWRNCVKLKPVFIILGVERGKEQAVEGTSDLFISCQRATVITLCAVRLRPDQVLLRLWGTSSAGLPCSPAFPLVLGGQRQLHEGSEDMRVHSSSSPLCHSIQRGAAGINRKLGQKVCAVHLKIEHIVLFCQWFCIKAAHLLCYSFSCILPAAVAPPTQLYAANPPPSYSLAQKSFRRQLQEVSAPHNAEIRSLACPTVVSFSDVHMLEMDSGMYWLGLLELVVLDKKVNVKVFRNI